MESHSKLPGRLRFYSTPLPTIQLKNGPGDTSRRVRSKGDWDCETDPSGHYAYSLESLYYYLHQWRIGADGILRPLTPHQVDAHSHPDSLRFHPSGRFAYVSCSHGAICQYQVRSGALVPLKPREVYASTSPSPLWFDRVGNYACAVTSGEGNGCPSTDRVHLYRVRTTGHLELVQKLEVRGASGKFSSAAFEGHISSFTLSGDSLSR
ncbi:MAG: hypothetical protein QM758_19365 [Armatimonas sp.]